MAMKTPSHPGRIVKSALEELDLSVAQAAEALGVSRNQLYLITTCKSAISVQMALRLEAVIGSTAIAWLKMQAAYDLAQARNAAGNPTDVLKKRRALLDDKEKTTEFA